MESTSTTSRGSAKTTAATLTAAAKRKRKRQRQAIARAMAPPIDYAALCSAEYPNPPVPPVGLSTESEHVQQKYIVKWLHAHPQRPLFFAPLNEAGNCSTHSPWHEPGGTADNNRFANISHWLSMGRAKGAPDLMFFDVRGEYNGLAVELKRNSTSVASVGQIQWLAELKQRGWSVHVANGFEDALRVITEYYSQVPRVLPVTAADDSDDSE